MKRRAFIGLVTGIVLSVAACGADGPTDTEVTTALTQYAQLSQQQADQVAKSIKENAEIVMQETDPKIAAKLQQLQSVADTVLKATAMKVATKVKRSDGGYDATIAITGPDGQKNAVVALSKTNTGWQVIEFHD